MPKEIERLRQEVHAHPTREGWLRLGNALYGSEDFRDVREALCAFREAEKLGALALEANHSEILGPNGMPIGAIQEPPLPDAERKKCLILKRRICAVAARGLEVRLPGLHRPMDADRRYYPRGTTQEAWDGLGTMTERERLPDARVPSTDEIPDPVPGVPSLPTVPGEVDPELSFDVDRG